MLGDGGGPSINGDGGGGNVRGGSEVQGHWSDNVCSLGRRGGCWRVVLESCVGELCWRVVLESCVGELRGRVVRERFGRREGRRWDVLKKD